MRSRILVTLALTVLAALPAKAQYDEAKLRQLDSMVTGYARMISLGSIEDKEGECDYLITSVSDTLLMTRIASTLFDYYKDSRLMGEEEVAIYVWDKWFSQGPLKMESDMDSAMDAMFADFNRSSLIGMDAPVIRLRRVGCCKRERIPREGRTTILFFYDTGCAKCLAESILLPQVIDSIGFAADFCAVYTGKDRKKAKEFAGAHFRFSNPNVRVHHLWDPEVSSDYQRLYGVLTTPRIFVIDPYGTIIGRRLELESLKELLPYAAAIQAQARNRN